MWCLSKCTPTHVTLLLTPPRFSHLTVKFVLLYASSASCTNRCLRTGGERRLSNFLLYEMAYAELDFVDEVFN